MSARVLHGPQPAIRLWFADRSGAANEAGYLPPRSSKLATSSAATAAVVPGPLWHQHLAVLDFLPHDRVRDLFFRHLVGTRSLKRSRNRSQRWSGPANGPAPG